MDKLLKRESELKQTRTIPGLRLLGLFGGPLTAFVILTTSPPSDLSPQGWNTAAVAIWMAIWWMTEAIPLAATGLLPLVLFPALGMNSLENTAELYAHPLIVLFLGGFLMARAVAVWGLDRLFANKVLQLVGTSPQRIIAAMMLVTAFLSMWISNTATSMLMLPIAMSVTSLFSAKDSAYARQFTPALLLGIAYAATIGGMGTIIGTPPNALFVAFMDTTYGIEITFVQWMQIGIPMLLILLPLAWLLLTRLLFNVGSNLPPMVDIAIAKQTSSIPSISTPQITILVILLLVATGWIFRPLIVTNFPGIGLTDAGIAMTGALLMFILPVDMKNYRFILTWKQATSIRWDVLMLFGGGLALAAQISATDLSAWIAANMEIFNTLPFFLFLLLLGLLIVMVGELASNTAMAAVFLPIAGAIALNLDVSPLMLTLPVALFATLGFMLPVATPPNAIVFGGGGLTLNQMMKAGAILDLAGVVIVALCFLSIGKWAFGL